ncbi:MAG: hypothetical protein JST26_15770 [Bacteroidetes bacterium]|nr:hypothetical protein [Bacteroidota bacterium]
MLLFRACNSQPESEASPAVQRYEISIRTQQRDSKFIIHSSKAAENYMRTLLASDHGYAQCKDCLATGIKNPAYLFYHTGR